MSNGYDRNELTRLYLAASSALESLRNYRESAKSGTDGRRAADKAIAALLKELKTVAPGPDSPGIIPAHGGYRDLKSYRNAEIVYDATTVFCDRFIDRFSRTRDQMVQAARSGKQNIAEGSAASGTSKKTELKLMNVARASLEELLLDYEDWLRQHDHPLWGKEHPRIAAIRKLAYAENRSYKTYKSYIEEANGEVAANTLICLIHQTNYLLNRLIAQLEQAFLNEGGFTERLYHARKAQRDGR